MQINEDFITQTQKRETVHLSTDDLYVIENRNDPDQKLLKKKIKSITKNMKGILV